MQLNLKKIVNPIVTLGPLGSLPFAGFLAVLAAIPAVYGIDMLIWGLPALYPGLHITLMGIVAGLLAITSMQDSTESLPASSIVINRVIGILFVFAGIPVTIKFLATGLVLFLLIRFAIPRLLHYYGGINYADLPSLFILLGLDLLAGFTVNLLFRFIFWLVIIS